jgi:hypothetical protein
MGKNAESIVTDVCEKEDRKAIEEIKKNFGAIKVRKDSEKEKIIEVVPYTLPDGCLYTPKILLFYNPFIWSASMEVRDGKKVIYQVHTATGIPMDLIKSLVELLKYDWMSGALRLDCERKRFSLEVNPKKWWQIF